MASGFYRYGHDLHPGHLDFTRPTSILFNHPKRPDTTHRHHKAVRGTEGNGAPTGLAHWPGSLGHTFLIGQPTTPHCFLLNGPWYHNLPGTRQSTERTWSPTPGRFVLVHWAALRNDNEPSR